MNERGERMKNAPDPVSFSPLNLKMVDERIHRMYQRKVSMMALIAAVCCLLMAGCQIAGSQKQISRTYDFCFDWKFFKGDAANASQMDSDESGWDDIRLPHDWSIAGPIDRKNPGGKDNGFFPGGIGWYRKHFRLSPDDEDKQIFIQFDGIYHNSEVWINGHSLGVRPYGYISFQHDLTPYVKFGQDNLLAVRVDNTDQPNCRWYTGSGIYRQVWLTVTDKLHVKHWGTYVATPQISEKKATVRIRTEVKNSYPQSQTCTLVTRILDSKGKIVAESEATQQIPAQDEYRFDQEIQVPDPQLWSIDNPMMYRVQTVIQNEKGICDIYETPFGIRQICFDKDKGFLLNGQQVKMKGVCIHHDAGCLGAAVPVRALERRLEILKSIGCNAIRTSHNPPSPELLDLCDRMGFVVIEEAFDKWEGRHGRWFDKWWQMDLQDMLRRDRNHPSVVMWSVGNEVSGQGRPQFVKQLKKLVDLTREFEPTRPVTCALKPFEVKSREENAKIVTNIAKIVDVISCNYQEQWFEDYRKEYPQIIIIASESYPYYRGKDMSYKAFEPLNPWLEAVKHDYVAGTFYWTGIDYLGEAVAGWPYHGWNCSLIDTCGFIRPFANLHKSFWTDKPMVHIAVMDDSLDVPEPVKDHWGWPKMDSHWNLPHLEGKQVKVVTFTNCRAVELFVNGKSMGTKELKDFPDKMITWTVPCVAGRIEAHGIDQGRITASHQLKTAGKPAKILLIADRERICADGRDLCHVEVQVTDEEGILVPDAEHEIQFSVEGAGTIIGVDNGDLTSMESYKADKRKAFDGRVLVIIQSAQQSGPITLKARSEGFPETKITIAACE
jgi:beta-galactosidase